MSEKIEKPETKKTVDAKAFMARKLEVMNRKSGAVYEHNAARVVANGGKK